MSVNIAAANGWRLFHSEPRALQSYTERSVSWMLSTKSRSILDIETTQSTMYVCMRGESSANQQGGKSRHLLNRKTAEPGSSNHSADSSKVCNFNERSISICLVLAEQSKPLRVSG